METTVPSPPNHFGARNGADLYCGQFDHESEDFGPETDVDMVDDVLLSPAITAAKKLVQGKDIEDDLERQRQQLSDFDDPADGDRSRDTPTPPAHEVGSNATVDPLGDSGEESEDEEWNYVPGKDPKPSNTEEEDDMSSQLNPNAAEFVPVSPTRLLMLDDAIISASGYEKSLDNVQLPSELEFDSEIKHRPGDLEFTNGHKHVDDYFMRDNFSTLRNKGKDFNVSSTCAEFGDSSILSFKTSSDTSMTECISENIPFDKLVPVKNFEEDKENLLEPSNDLTNSSFGTTNLFGKGDPMTTSVMGFTSSPEPENEDSAFPGTPKSTTVEAPVSPLNDDVSPLNLQTDLEPSKEDLMANEPMSPVGGVQEKASSLGFGSESETEEVAHEDNEGFVLEHRRSPPIDLSFKPIQTFSDTNPFGALQTPSVTTPMDQLGESSLPLENHNSIEESSKVEEVNRYSNDMFDITSNSPVSFISLRSPTKEEQVPFDELESPKDELHFEPLPNANSSMIPTEVPNSPEPEKPIEESTLVETTPAKENCKSFEDLDTTAGFMEVESKVLLDEQEHEQVSKITDETTVETSEPTKLLENGVDSPSENEIVVEKVLTAFDDIKDEFESHEEKKELDLEVETREMKLEFESHIAPLDISPDDLKNIDEGFEVISKEELETSNSDHNGPNECSLPPNDVSGIVDLPSPTAQTNPFVTDNDFSANLLETKNEPKSDLMNAIENFGSALENDLIKPEHLIKPEQSAQLTSSTDILPSIEPEAEKTFSYQTLTPADEPKLTKVEAYVTGVDENLIETSQEAAENLVDKSQTFEDNFLEKPQVIEENFVVTASVPEEPKAPVFDEPSLVQSEQIQSQVVTETLIQTLEEKSEVQSLATTEVPSSTDTPPSTPAPGLEDKDDIQKTDILVAAVAAAGAVAAGTAVVAEKEAKKASPAPIKKPAVTTTKKLDTAPKAPAKTVPAKAPAAKPAPTKTTTKPATTTTKPATTTATSKPAASKPASTVAAAKKPAPTTTTLKSSPAKPITTTTSKPATTSAPKPAASAPKQVPKQLPVNKTSTLTMKPGSKPTTPTSKPTTPTTPKSPSVLKTDVKSPSRPAVKSTLAAKPMSKPTGPAEKKPLTNGDVKPLAKKTEDVVKKPLTATKTTTARPASAPVSKTAVPPVKAATTGINKAAPTKPTTTTQPKPKAPTTTAATKPAVPPPIRRPTSATVPKPSEKPSKETANKLISNTKPATNGKAVPAKTAAATKKTDVKMNGKNVPVKVVPKKAEEVKKEEESEIKIQEDNVTTTNGFADHIIEENGSMKFEELTPVILDGVN